MTRILVTGASGFIGSALVEALAGQGLTVRAAYRALPAARCFPDQIAVGDLGPATDWGRALEDVSHIVHLAGPAHRRAKEAEYRRAIVEGTAALAEQAERAGAKRFVFMSSIKAAAERGGPVSEQDLPAPESLYGKAKLEAEGHVLARSALAPVVLRPPLVHAPNVRGNFALLLRLADTPVPLPLGGIRNLRSFIARETLIAAILAVLGANRGPSGLFHIADHPACSTSELVALLRQGMGRSERLFHAPALSAVLPRVLTENLEVDDSAFRAAYSYGARADADARQELVRCGAAWRNAR